MFGTGVVRRRPSGKRRPSSALPAKRASGAKRPEAVRAARLAREAVREAQSAERAANEAAARHNHLAQRIVRRASRATEEAPWDELRVAARTAALVAEEEAPTRGLDRDRSARVERFVTDVASPDVLRCLSVAADLAEETEDPARLRNFLRATSNFRATRAVELLVRLYEDRAERGARFPSDA